MKYLLTFYKKGYAIYTSHLDMLRFFKRSFKRIDIQLQHSNGFHPHPKMSFAQPLSLGYSAKREYLEFETVEDLEPTSLKGRLNEIMPEGLGITECCRLPQGGKTLAALVERADYDITIPHVQLLGEELQQAISDFLSQQQILIKKLQKKTKKEMETDIRSMIFSVSMENNRIGEKEDLTLLVQLSAGSSANLSPEYFLNAFFEYLGISTDRAEIRICRTELYGPSCRSLHSFCIK